MKNIVVYVHGKGGSAEEAVHYKPLFPESEVIGFDYRSQTPWEAAGEFPLFFAGLRERCDRLTLIANSIGAFFSMSSLNETMADDARFISPVVDMERLIGDMMMWAGVSERELAERSEIPTDFGEVLSWRYLTYVREHPVVWHVPTRILYGERDELTSFETISAFAGRIGAELTVMPGGEHWFHTDEQMHFFDNWLTKRTDRKCCIINRRAFCAAVACSCDCCFLRAIRAVGRSCAVGRYFSGYFSAAFTKAAKSAACSGCAAASSSGCHCTATRKRPLSVVSTPSTVPSSERALTRSVSAGRFTDW